MHNAYTPAVEATPTYRELDSPRPAAKGGLPPPPLHSSFSPSPAVLRPSRLPFSPLSDSSISCYFIVLRLNSGSRRLYRYRVTYAHVSSTCKETHMHVRNSRGDTRTIHVRACARTHTRTHEYVPRRSWGERCVCRYTEYLALSIQRKGITYYRRLPARRALIYCYPVRISCGKKRILAEPRSPRRQRSPWLPSLTLR